VDAGGRWIKDWSFERLARLRELQVTFDLLDFFFLLTDP
jgi:hypothetical protein